MAFVAASILSAVTFAVLLNADADQVDETFFSLQSAPHLSAKKSASTPTVASLISQKTAVASLTSLPFQTAADQNEQENEPGVLVSDRIVKSAGKGTPTLVTLQQMDQVRESREDLAVWIWGRGGGWGGVGSSLGADIGRKSSAVSGNGEAEMQPVHRIKELDGLPLRDLTTTSTGIAAVDQNGTLHHIDLTSPAGPGPTRTLLKGLNLTRVAYAQPKHTNPTTTRGKPTPSPTENGPLPLYALTSSGALYRINTDTAPARRSWLAWFGYGLNGVEQVRFALSKKSLVSVAAGRQHVVALSSNGKVFTAAVSPFSGKAEKVNAFGELGIGHEEASDGKLREVQGLRGINIVQVAAGDAFCLARADDGRVFAWGANTFGQLGTGYLSDIPMSPTPMEVQTLWTRKRSTPRPSDARCSLIAAGGSTAAFVVDRSDKTEVLTCGMGLFGQLGQGGFSHLVNIPTPIPALTNLTEYSERLNRRTPIRVASLSVGPAHCMCILDSTASTTKDFGRDAVGWGLNDRGQLRRADGRKGNTGTPLWMAPVRSGNGEDGVIGRLQVFGSGWVGRGLWGKVKVEEAFACGDGFTVLYPRAVR
ncbi:hypothetical protein HDU67_003472 [Dinochytrium kinnereticum]|nr:hypothetical protein HDU67_003472 [Dinochytrium kinnereticum]